MAVTRERVLTAVREIEALMAEEHRVHGVQAVDVSHYLGDGWTWTSTVPLLEALAAEGRLHRVVLAWGEEEVRRVPHYRTVGS